MATPNQVRPAPLIIFLLFVCAAGAVTGGFFGLLAALLYLAVSDHSLVSVVRSDYAGLVGAGSGLVAALLWCRIMIPRSIASYRAGLPSGGTRFGILAGVVSATLLHVGLMYLADRVQIGSLLVGVIFGVVVGAMVGALCGALCRRAVRAAWPDAVPSVPPANDPQSGADNPPPD